MSTYSVFSQTVHELNHINIKPKLQESHYCINIHQIFHFFQVLTSYISFASWLWASVLIIHSSSSVILGWTYRELDIRALGCAHYCKDSAGQDGSTRIQDILARFLHSRRNWRRLYCFLCQWS